MRTLRYLAPVVFGVALTSPVLAGQTVHDLTGFDKIEVSGGVKVRVFSGSKFSVVSDVSGTARERRLTVKQEGDTLSIRRKPVSSMVLMGMADYYLVTVHLPRLTSIEGSSGADVEVSGTFTDDFQALTSSGADLDVEGLDADTIVLKASSGSDIDVSGVCVSLEADASSGSDIDAEDLECQDVTARSSSGSDIEVHALRRLSARASSGSDIEVEGSPADVTVETSSGGDVNLPGT